MPVCSPRSLAALLLAATLATGALVPAQEAATQKQEPPTRNGRWRLEHRLQNPLLYLSRLGPALVDPLPLLNDPVLQRLLGQRAPGGFAAGRGALLRPLARLLSSKSEDLELALTKMVRAVNGETETPYLIFRCQLLPASAEQVSKVLRDSLAEPSRKLHGQQVYRLKGPGSVEERGRRDPQVEVVLVGNNLVVSNDPLALGQAINPHTVAGAPVLSQDARYKDLRKRIGVPKGAVMLYADWRRLGPRLSIMLQMEFGLPFRWSGLGDTDRLLLVVRPAKRGRDGFVTSVLLGRRPPRRPTHRPQRGHDGWLQAVEAAKPLQLLSGLHHGGVGSLAVAFDPKKLLGPAARGPRMRRLQGWIFGHAFQVGLDVRRQVIRRLGKIGGAQVMLLPGDGVRPRVAYSFQAKTSKQARDLVMGLKKALANSGRARCRQLDSGKEVLEIESPGFGRHSFGRRFGGSDYALLAAVGDSVYLTFDRDTMAQVMSRNRSRQTRAQQDAMVRQYLRHLGAWDKKVAGIFIGDLSSIATRVVGKPNVGKGGEDNKDQGKPKPTPGLFGMHAGYFTVEQGLVRLEVFSPR